MSEAEKVQLQKELVLESNKLIREKAELSQLKILRDTVKGKR